MLSCQLSWIFVDMHDASQVGSCNFLTKEWLLCAYNRTHGKCLRFQHGLKMFQTISNCWQGRREGRQGGGQLASGPKQVWAPS